MKRLSILFLLTVTVALAASCSKIYGPVKELDAYIDVKEAILSDWAKNVDAHPDQSGVDACRKTFEAKKADLVAARKTYDAAPQGINPDTVNHKLWASEDADKRILDAMADKFALAPLGTSDSFQKLRKDFEDASERYK